MRSACAGATPVSHGRPICCQEAHRSEITCCLPVPEAISAASAMALRVQGRLLPVACPCPASQPVSREAAVRQGSSAKQICHVLCRRMESCLSEGDDIAVC